ncbi:PSME3-interacting protein-like [Halichondria panicea]|uniref:PSME3-interacting protein-like n=1 Tax=Halichondria panicea TaxID=6063 RepID=UPI00312B2FDA
MAVPIFKSFVTEQEVEEVKKKRQEEWERVRKPSDPLERPEAAVDNRTLYERLKEQKDQKQEEFTEKFKFKNMIYKGLDDDESVFLTHVAERRAEHEADVIRSEISEVTAYREAVSKLHDDDIEPTVKDVGEGSTEGKDKTAQLVVKKNKSKSQLSLIAGSIKTKRKRTSSDSRESKEAASGRESESTPDKKAKLSDAQASCENTSTTVSSSASSQLGALSGLAAYSSSESDNGD